MERLRAFLDDGYMTGASTGNFTIGPLKLLGDGALGARTAAMKDAYLDDPENRGILNFRDDEINELVMTAHKAGMQIAIVALWLICPVKKPFRSAFCMRAARPWMARRFLLSNSHTLQTDIYGFREHLGWLSQGHACHYEHDCQHKKTYEHICLLFHPLRSSRIPFTAAFQVS